MTDWTGTSGYFVEGELKTHLILLGEEMSRYEELVSLVREDLIGGLERAIEEDPDSGYTANLLRDITAVNDGLCDNAGNLIFVPDDLKPTQK